MSEFWKETSVRKSVIIKTVEQERVNKSKSRHKYGKDHKNEQQVQT